jgi:lantibiotic modifying enzyme
MIPAETLAIPAETLARLATRASMLEERLAPPFVTSPENHSNQIDVRISRWAELGAKGDRERLRRSLHWRGIDLDRIRPALGDVSLSPEAALPEWVLRFDALLEAALGEHRHAAPDTPPPANERAAVMSPFLRAAAASLRKAIPAHARAYVADTALAALEQSLLLRLTRLTGAALAGEYYVFSYGDSRAGGDAETRAQRFADRVLRPPLPEFLAEYPVLARLVTLACDNWQAAAIELLGRLADDREAIIAQFHEGRDPGPLVDIQVGDADVHDGHREVVILVFEDGLRIVYKPRSMALDHAFHGLVNWLNERGLSPSLRSPAALCRDGYGWAEFIAHRLAEGAEELALFYERSGVLACVAYVMGSSDLHYGNVIAHGGYPVVIDLETMLRAEPRTGALPEQAAAVQIANLGVQRSVLASMFLPLTHRIPTGIYADLSALGAEPDGEFAKQGGSWLPVRDTPLKQVLRDHISTIEKGFVSAYRFIEGQRDALLSDGGPLAAFERSAIRVVLRDTSLYFQLLRHSIDPSILRDSADRMIALERVNHVIAISDTTPSFVDMVTHEQSTLSRLDVPRFLVMTDETDLRDAAGLVAANVMERTPLAEMRLRIEAMSESDLQQQCTDIRWSLIGHIAGKPESRHSLSPQPPDATTLIAAAERLGEDILARADTGGDTPPSWRGLVYLNAARCFTAGDPGAGFADGGLGIAAFLAALFRVTGNPKWQTAALRLSLRYLIPISNSVVYHGHVAGGISAGLGGSLYAAALIAAFAESDEILENGIALAQRLAARAVAEDREMSLGDGLAGTLLGIAALRRLAPAAGLEDAAELGATRLRDAKPLAARGLLSGQAGVALAASAMGLTGDFSIPFGTPPAEAAIDWAEGAVGLALAALQTDPGASRALDFLAGLASAPMAADDSFAFGTAGEADALAWAANRSGRPELHRLALRRIAGTATRAQQGAPRLLGGAFSEELRMPDLLPGLLHGSAGIGYALLRLAALGRLPSLAVFELPAERYP